MSSKPETQAHNHNAVVREEFTRQADAYAKAAVITDTDRLARLVQAINPDPAARALEVATGPGYVAMALAARCREVVGLDLTAAPIAIAERTSRERGIGNVRFQIGDAGQLPFGNEEFDIVVCRFAFHHFENPAAILAQMCRVCRSGGMVAVEDLFASEHLERAAYYNHIERLRDHSHTRALALSELALMMAAQRLDIDRVFSDRIETDVELWLAGAQAGAGDSTEVRRLLAEDIAKDLSGSYPFVRDGVLHFVQRTTAIVGHKLAQR